ncbi:MAG: sigma-54-dependent Fis family transcriptional regulator, partial [Alphaproteobacteria bacterium]|nr:sigma-54-dependent Fis family transcriptional regulator [Alphaproteobacteria bacterium]
MLARAIHHSGARGARAFVHFDPRNYSAEEAEITLFGDPYRFYGNRIERHGLISAAEGGTLFIHPVEDLPSAVQPQLLRLIEHGLVRQRGSRTTRHCDVRIISAGADEFDPKHRADIWREDLYYALASVRIALPPLRERREDIVQIAQDILTIVLPRLGLSACQLGKRARVLLTAYDWPGNVRQLQSVLLRAVLRSEKETLDLDDFEALVTVMPAIHSHQPDARTMQNGGILLFDEAGHIRPLEHIEADIIHLAISHYRGRMSEVARRLGIGRATLYRRLADLDQSGSI